MKKIIVFIFCLSIIFTGCGTTTKSKAPASTDALKEIKTEEEITLNVTLWDYTSLEYHNKLVSEFEIKYPNVKVNVIEAPASDYSDKVAVMLSGDNDIDVVFVRDTASYTALISKNQLEPLDTYIKDSNIDLSLYGGMAEQYAVNGEMYGLPYRKDIWMLFYNKDLFDAAGIEYPSDNMTYDEYRKVANLLTSGEGSERVYGALNNKWTQSVSNLAMGSGEYSLLDGNYDFLVPYYELVLGMQNEDKSTLDYATIIASNIHYSGPFYNGQVGMMPMGSWFINNMIENTENGSTSVQWDVAALPSMDDDMNGKGVGSILPVSVGSQSKNKEMAWKFVEFVTTEAGASVLAQTGIMPAYSSASVLDILTGIEGFPAHGKELLLATKDITIEFPVDEKWTAISKIIGEEHELIMINSNTPTKGIEVLNNRIKEEGLTN